MLPRVIKLPPKLAGCDHGFVFLSSIIHAHVGELFAGMEVQGCYQFRVTRNSDLFVDEEEMKNLRTALQGELPQRHFGDAVRLEVADLCPPDMSEFLLQQFGLSQRRPVSGERPGEPGAADADSGLGRSRRPEVRAVQPPACRRRWSSSRTCSTRSPRATSCCTTRSSRSSR